MSIYVYNTLSKKKELFQPITPGKVLIYVCGPTVYDSCHIGHARSVVVFDVIVRYLRSQGFDVVYVRNFTDVDDKIINRANELGVHPKALADKYIKEFHRDMEALNVNRATVEPRVTEHMGEIIESIEKLIEKGAAYHVEGNVYFAVTSFREYGKLSHRNLEDMNAGARVGIDMRKRNPFDFSLWKPSKPGEPSWESPWGKGRPGWHIECSVMSSKYLGETFDIHGGGKDLIFPHHENEIAQSEALHDKVFAHYWIHNGFIKIRQEKMSKSLGNFLMIKDVIRTHHPEALRLFLLSKQYRKPIDFSDKAIEESSTALERIYTLLLRIGEIVPERTVFKPWRTTMTYWDSFRRAMDDDFNTAGGIAAIFNAVRDANRMINAISDDTADGATVESLEHIGSEIMKMGRVLGIINHDPKMFFKSRKTSVLEKEAIDESIIEGMIAERTEARKAKDWKKADRIRDELAAMHIILEDRSEGTFWKIGE